LKEINKMKNLEGKAESRISGKNKLKFLYIAAVVGGLTAWDGYLTDGWTKGEGRKEECPIVIPYGMNPIDANITTADVNCDRVRLVGKNGEFYGLIAPKKSKGQDTQNYCNNKLMLRNEKGGCDYFPPKSQ